jgi:cytochrome c556
MRRIAINVLALTVAFGGVALVAQKVTTVAELDTTMKRVGQNQGATNKAVMSGAYADARKTLAIVRASLADSENFWIVNKKADAIMMAKDTMSNLAKIDEMLAAPAPDGQAILAALKGAGCGACHKQYREQLPDMTYQIKPGTI